MGTDEDDEKRRDRAHRLRVASRKCYEKNPLKKGASYVKKRIAEGRSVKPKTLEKYRMYLDPDELPVVSEME